MKSQKIAFGVVGLLVGFVFGFFVSRSLEEPAPAAPAAQAAASGQQVQLPEGHPPLDPMANIESLEQHAREHPEHTEVKIQLGNAYFDLHRFDLAIQWYEEAKQQEPDNVQLNNNLSTAYYASGEIDKAVQLLEETLTQVKDQPEALMNLGWIYFATDRFDTAISYWERLVEVHPGFQAIEEVKEQLEKARAHTRGEHSG